VGACRLAWDDIGDQAIRCVDTRKSSVFGGERNAQNRENAA
jgi:hypothetical protein